MKRLLIVFIFTVFATNLYGQSIQQTEDSLHNYFSAHKDSLDPIEGLWDVVSTQEYYHFDTLYDVVKYPKPARVAIIKKGNKYQVYNMKGESYNVEFSQTEVKSVYFYRNFFPQINQYSEMQTIICKSGEMEFTYDFPESDLRIKLGDKYKDGTRLVNVLKWKKIF